MRVTYPGIAQEMHMPRDQQRKRNMRLGLILGSIALVLFFGIMVRWALLGS